ncbi:MAG: FadR family transcriptional regulator [Dorea sp.]|jgi:DNA-binding FadR family transcriptional regulator|nr:FadR family transcriptional regulator [Dorea sp.]
MGIGNRAARTLLYEEVVKDLYQMIDDEHLKPGDKMPPERELMEQLDVSRNVLREAFRVLESRGVIVSHQGKGRFLRKQSQLIGSTDSLSKNLERCSMIEAYEVRQPLEVRGVELIIRNASERDIEDLENAYRALEKRFQETGRTEGEFKLHKLYAAKTGSVFMTQTLEIVLNAIFDMMYGKFSDILEKVSGEEELESHRRIIQAIRDRDKERAGRLMYEHLQDSIDCLKQ